MTIIKHKNQRVGVFIDTQNLYHSAKHLYSRRVNFKNVLISAVAGRSLVRAIAYVVNTDTDEERTFFDALEKSGIETRSKDLQVFAGGAKKGDWDVGLAIDAVTMADSLDSVVIASGDGDFVPLVRYLKSRGCQVEVISFARSSSSKLMEEVDEFIDMADDTDNFLMGGYNRRRQSGSRNGQINHRNSRDTRSVMATQVEVSDEPEVKMEAKKPTKPKATAKTKAKAKPKTTVKAKTKAKSKTNVRRKK